MSVTPLPCKTETCSNMTTDIVCKECWRKATGPSFSFSINNGTVIQNETIIQEVMETHSETFKRLAEYEQQELKALKFDTGKPKLSLLNSASLKLEADAMEYGAQKYARNNYRAGMEWTRMIDAALRHITAFANGESIDSESGVNHIGHAKACLGMLAYYIENKVGKDDR